MDKIAFILGENFVYWNSLILTAAAAVAICFFLAFYIGKCGNVVAGFAVIPLSMVLGLVFARFFHWYSRSDSYSGFWAAMTDYRAGGYTLFGVFVGCAAGAALTRLVRLHRNLPRMLDCMAIGGCAGIVVGRMASFFNSSDRGQVLEGFTGLPFVYPVTNAVSGAVEYRLATFLFQAVAALVLFTALGMFYIRGQKKGLRDGDTCLIFLLCYGASQVLLDSTRYDSLFFRSNGFVSIVQVMGALGLGLSIVLFSIRMVKAKGFRFWFVPVWLVMAAAIGGAGFMEYYVQRHGDQALFAYSVMGGCLAFIIAMTLLVRAIAVKAEAEKEKIVE